MITFEKIIIDDFMSIKHLEFDFKSGNNAVIGQNGAGKTQTLIALLQGLFNKNPKSENDKLEETYNKVTLQPYRIEIHFIKDGFNYVVINDRKANKIMILQDGVDISPKGIKSQLAKIEEILDMNYSVFSAFYYLSTITIRNIFDISNAENLVYKFFDIDTINALNKFLKNKNKEFKKEFQLSMAMLNSIKKQLATIQDFDLVDKDKLINQKLVLQESLLSLQESKDKKKIILLQTQIDTIDKKIAELREQFVSYDNTRKYIKKQLEQLKDGVCPVCGSKVIENVEHLENDYADLLEKQKSLSEQKNDLLDEKEKIKAILIDIRTDYEVKEAKLKRELSMIEDKLLMYEKDFEKYQRLQNNIKELEEEQEKTKANLEDIKQKLSFLSIALAVIKSNAITKEYLKSFILLLNNKVKELSSYLDFKIDIFVYETKGKINFKFLDNEVEKTLNGLSSGEKTRVALVVLFSVLETLQILAQNKINLIVLDELLGVLDKQGIEMLKKLLDKYRKQMAIYVVLHHKEIELNYFDRVYQVEKVNELTEIKELE